MKSWPCADSLPWLALAAVWGSMAGALILLVVILLRQPADPPTVELPPVYAETVCDRMGPYPYTVDSLDLWVVVCPKGDAP